MRREGGEGRCEEREERGGDGWEGRQEWEGGEEGRGRMKGRGRTGERGEEGEVRGRGGGKGKDGGKRKKGERKGREKGRREREGEGGGERRKRREKGEGGGYATRKNTSHNSIMSFLQQYQLKCSINLPCPLVKPFRADCGYILATSVVSFCGFLLGSHVQQEQTTLLVIC